MKYVFWGRFFTLAVPTIIAFMIFYPTSELNDYKYAKGKIKSIKFIIEPSNEKIFDDTTSINEILSHINSSKEIKVRNPKVVRDIIRVKILFKNSDEDELRLYFRTDSLDFPKVLNHDKNYLCDSLFHFVKKRVLKNKLT
jgi:hypothetical protein